MSPHATASTRDASRARLILRRWGTIAAEGVVGAAVFLLPLFWHRVDFLDIFDASQWVWISLAICGLGGAYLTQVPGFDALIAAAREPSESRHKTTEGIE